MQPVRILGGRAGQLLPQLLPEIGRAHHAGKRVLLLVPEQYTLQAERDLIDGLALPGLIDLDVLSPRRLSQRIRERGGRDPLPPLTDRGRVMALSQALALVRDDLTCYRSVADRPGLPDKLSSLLSDLQKAGMTADELSAYAAQLPPGAARAKQEDVARVFAAYEAILAGRFADETAQQEELIRRLKPSGVMDGAAVWVYGFDVLPEPFCRLLTEAATLADSLAVALVMDAKEALDGRIFLTQRRTAADLSRHLDERGVPCVIRYLPLIDDGRAIALRHLERYLFTRRDAPFDGDASCVAIHAAATPYAEAAWAAARLRAWHDAGIPWGRMAVALASTGGLDGLLDVTLAAAGIPHYLARKDSAARHGLCRFLTGALRAATGGYRQEDVLTVVKSGFSPLAEEERFALENYALENGVNHMKWLRPFTRGDAERMEPLRLRLIEPIARLQTRLREARTAEASVRAVYLLLEETDAYARLLEREEALLSRGMLAEASQNRQVWKIVMELLDQLYALLGERRAAMRDIARFVESGLTGATISALPPQPDAVMAGEAGHLMTGRVDALILMGLQDGVMASGMDSLLSEREREALSDALRRPVGLTRLEQAALRQADFYRTVALPGREIAFTYSLGGQDGAALRPAGLIDDVRALLPGVTVTGGVTAQDDAPLSPLMALDGLSTRLRALMDGQEAALDPAWQEALRCLLQSEQWHDRAALLLDGLSARVHAEPIPYATARRLFTQDSVSISRLETFAACPFRHFVDYGLKPVARRPFAFAADEKGSFFHAALRDYATLAAATPSWPEVSAQEIDRMMDQVLSPLTRAWEDGPLGEDALGRQLGESYVRAVRRAAWLFTNHARNSRFVTCGTEVAFGMEGGLPPVILTLHDGRRVALRGKIDRIDRYEGDTGVYLRVIDYKSSPHGLDPVRMWYGLQLQLLLYLRAVTQGNTGALPAGAFYFTVRDPMVDTPEDIRAEAERQIAQSLHLKGVVLAEAEVVDAMDEEQKQFSIDKVFNKDGSVAKTAAAFPLPELRALLDHAERTAAQLADRIRQGEIAVAPAAIDQWSACDYCDYAAVCRLDPALPGGEKRVLDCAVRKDFAQRVANNPVSVEE